MSNGYNIKIKDMSMDKQLLLLLFKKKKKKDRRSQKTQSRSMQVMLPTLYGSYP